MNKRIVVTGPESTGKSAIAAHLAERFAVPVAMEYARIHLERNGPAYDYATLLEMSRRHREYQLEQVPAAAPLGIFDTDLINYKIWCEVVFGKCHPEIIRAMQQETNHVYLLCYPDLPWEPDPLRENPNDLKALFDRHLHEIESLKRPCVIVRGRGKARFDAAEKAALELT